jgi:hypothetical protein
MIYAQIKAGRKLHYAMQPGEYDRHGRIVMADELSRPICGTPMNTDTYRMTCNVSLAHACQRCRAIAARWAVARSAATRRQRKSA